MNPAIHFPADLPIVGHQELILDTLANHQVVIIAGETGSGKTTQLPKLCLLAGRGRKRLIGCTQPRRIAATSVAARVAEELGDQAMLVAHKIRFQDRTTRATRIKFMTDGILLAESQRDPLLRAYDTIMVDEAHERTLNIDFLLGILKRLLPRRRDLQVIISSATLDTEKFSRHFDGAPVIEVSGRTYPVEVRYHPPAGAEEEEGSHVEQAVEMVCRLRREEKPGDILIFMPTERDIRETAEVLQEKLRSEAENRVRWSASPLILPLYGRLAGADQNRVFAPARGQKIVIATNVAETSVTVPGIRYVVDTGLARMAFYNVRARTTKMPVVRISRASADQRRGRCGRVAPGLCLRLYGEEDYENRQEYTPPEILRSNLAEVILRMLSLGLGEPADFPFVDPPSARAIRDGNQLLQELGALDAQRQLTSRGRLMARLPLDPRISRMIIEARVTNCLQEISVIAAALSIQDPRIRPADQEKEADRAHAQFTVNGSDFLSYLQIWERSRQVWQQARSQSGMRKFCRSHFLSYQRMREWQDIHDQIRLLLEEENRAPGRNGRFLFNTAEAGPEAIHTAILSGSLRNIGLKKEKNVYQAANDKEVVIFPGSGQYNRAGQWIMAAELVETSRLFARTVATINPAWLEPLAGSLCRSSYSSPHWEKKRGQVVALEKVTLFGLVIVANRRVNFGRLKPAEARQIFIQSGLLEGEIKGEYGFLTHNRRLLADLEKMENRLRIRDIVADEQTLQEFYDRRLPPEIMDQAGLNRFLKKQTSDQALRMTREDLLLTAPAEEQLEQFPQTLTVGELPLRLTYCFQPGSEEDGITVQLPLNILPQIESEIFEWLVPGLLSDKITFLCKGLPKSLRKQLIPLPQTVAELRRTLRPYQGSLYEALEEALARSRQVRVERRQWPRESLPPHLRMRFSLRDAQGKELQASRTWGELGRAATGSAGNFLPQAKAVWERGGINSWDFAELSERMPLTDPGGKLRAFGYPALVPDGPAAVAIRLADDEAEARRLTREGLLFLYELQAPKLFKAARRDFRLPRTDWPLYEGLGGHELFNDQLVAFILAEICATREGRLPSREEFNDKVSELKNRGLHQPGIELKAEIRELLRERRNTIEHLSRFEGLTKPAAPARFAGYRRQLEAILPPDFLQCFSRPQLNDASRYLKGLRIRVERAHAAPAKDSAKAALVAPHEEHLKSCQARTLPAAAQKEVEEFSRMLEEYKISLFAQELKTAFPISAKRLVKKWEEIKKIMVK